MAKKAATKEPAEVQRVQIYWRDHDDQSVRAWRSDWAGDQFEVISKVAFNTFKLVGERVGAVEIVKAEDE